MNSSIAPGRAFARLALAGFVVSSFTLTAGCFKIDPSGDPDDTETTDTDTGDDGSCLLGTEDCPCTPGGSCDPGFVCEVGICVAEDPTECGNGIVEAEEECDDANEDETDECTSLCAAPSCEDGIVSGDETDVDCGGSCEQGCIFDQACLGDDDCAFPNCNAESATCDPPLSCAHLQLLVPDTRDGVHTIDIDGSGAADLQPPIDVLCRTTNNGGGWTLGMTASDDDVDTWTWNNRAMLANEVGEVGSLDAPTLDFMSLAYHLMPFTDILFVHEPSGVWAHYASINDGASSLGELVAMFGSPICDMGLAGNGFELASGSTLTASGTLCDTDLYFNLGDHEDGIPACQDIASPSNTAAFGPVWNSDHGDGCPFDDPADVGIGPHGPCGVCPAEFPATEFPKLGYAAALDLNSGMSKSGENHLQIYMR